MRRGKSDAVFSFALDIYRPHAQFNGSFYIVIPERGGEIETITARLVRSYLHLAPQPDAWDLRQEIVDRLAPHFEAIVVDGTGIADHVEPSELRVVRDHGKTWLVMQRQDVVTRFKNALVLARVEKDGRQTPVCMYDRTRPPPFAQW